MAGNQDVISPIELEDIVGCLKPTAGIECVGSGKLWHRQVNYTWLHVTKDIGLGCLNVCALQVRHLPWAVFVWAEKG